MIRRRLKDFFLARHANRIILDVLNSEELTLIERFLSAKEEDRKQYLAAELMERTLYNIDPRFQVFLRLFELESERMTAMEKGMTYMRESYRSHYIHSVYNYLMGFFLFQEEYLGEEFLNCLYLDYFDTHYCEKHMYDVNPVTCADERKEFQIRWALTTFFHDVAYLPQLNLKIMEEEGERQTGIEKPFSLEVSDMESFLTIHMISKIKAKIKMSFAPDYLFSEDSLEILAYRLVNRLDRFSKDLIYQSLKARFIETLKAGRFDHGLMGAIFLLQQFYSLIYNFFVDDGKNDISPILKFSINRNIIRFTDAMAAVSLHNIRYFKTGIFKKELGIKIKNHKLPLLFLLILCDELQTWDRELSPPEERTRSSVLRAIRNKKPDKNMFIEHYNDLYRDYASVKKEEKKVVFMVPFQEDDENDDAPEKEFLIFNKDSLKKRLKNTIINKKEEDKIIYIYLNNRKKENLKKVCALKIKFKIKPHYYLDKLLENNDKLSSESKIDKKIYKQMEKEAWKSFKGKNLTLGTFIDLAFAVKKFLICYDKAPENKNNAVVQGIETLTGDILPALNLLKKGQDILSPFLRPYHFYDITGNDREKSDQNYCSLLLHYPGKEVNEIETAIKKRIFKKLYQGEKKEIALKYTNAPEAALNRIINEVYIQTIENYIYGIQTGQFIVIEMNGGKDEGK